jgi:hypothetical protein
MFKHQILNKKSNSFKNHYKHQNKPRKKNKKFNKNAYASGEKLADKCSSFWRKSLPISFVNLCGAKKPIPANSHPFSLHQKGQLN